MAQNALVRRSMVRAPRAARAVRAHAAHASAERTSEANALSLPSTDGWFEAKEGKRPASGALDARRRRHAFVGAARGTRTRAHALSHEAPPSSSLVFGGFASSWVSRSPVRAAVLRKLEKKKCGPCSVRGPSLLVCAQPTAGGGADEAVGTLRRWNCSGDDGRRSRRTEGCRR